MTKEFMRRTIKIHADSLPEKVREACRVRAREERMSLQQQLEMLTRETMKDWCPECHIGGGNHALSCSHHHENAREA